MTVYIDRTGEPDDVFEREVLARVGDPVTAEMPPAEAQQDDGCDRYCMAPHGSHHPRCAALAARPSADTEKLRARLVAEFASLEVYCRGLDHAELAEVVLGIMGGSR